MTPPKKPKKSKPKAKDPSKSKCNSSSEPRASEPKATFDDEWWYSFWHKNGNSGSNIPLGEEEAFKYFFRVSKDTFEYICSLVREDLVSRPPSGLINIEGRLLSVEKQVAIAMRRLASGESQVSVGGAFSVGQSTVSQVTWRFVESMEDRARHHMKWPEPERMEQIKEKLEVTFGLPNCCGAIDATHIIMTLPAVESSDDWCDQESNYSMFLQGIVDQETRLLDIVTGWPGSMTFSCLLKFSGFYKLCESGKRLNGPTKMSAERAEFRVHSGRLGLPSSSLAHDSIRRERPLIFHGELQFEAQGRELGGSCTSCRASFLCYASFTILSSTVETSCTVMLP